MSFATTVVNGMSGREATVLLIRLASVETGRGRVVAEASGLQMRRYTSKHGKTVMGDITL